KTAEITFDYLDAKQGALLQVFHTGTTNLDLEITGTVMGGKPIRRILLGSMMLQKPPRRWVSFPLLVLLWIMLGVLVYLERTNPYREYVWQSGQTDLKDIVFSFFPAILLCGIGLLTSIHLYRFWLGSVPHPLSKIHDDFS